MVYGHDDDADNDDDNDDDVVVVLSDFMAILAATAAADGRSNRQHKLVFGCCCGSVDVDKDDNRWAKAATSSGSSTSCINLPMRIDVTPASVKA